MIKKYNEFINESSVPGPEEPSASKIHLTDEEVDWFSSEPALQKLISDNKVSLLPPELWYTIDDRNTINTLEDFFPNAEFKMEDEEDYEEEESEGYDEENESVNEGMLDPIDNGEEKLLLDFYVKLTENGWLKDSAPVNAVSFIKSYLKKGPESYRDKMKDKVAKSKENHKNKIFHP